MKKAPLASRQQTAVNSPHRSIEQRYQKKTQLEHILLRPDTYSKSPRAVFNYLSRLLVSFRQEAPRSDRGQDTAPHTTHSTKRNKMPSWKSWMKRACTSGCYSHGRDLTLASVQMPGLAPQTSSEYVSLHALESLRSSKGSIESRSSTGMKE